MRLAVFGSGYVGLVTGTCLAEVGHDVTCVDIDPAKVQRLARGDPVIYEPGLAELLARNLAAGKLRFTTDAASAVRGKSAIFIAVGTPQAADGTADLRAFFAACNDIAQHCDEGAVIIDKSTVPVQTASTVERIFTDAGKRIHIVSNPETLREGNALRDFMSPDRIIVGSRTPEGFACVRDIYSPLLIRQDGGRILEMSPESAELTKYAANAMLAMRISFVNFLSQVAARTNADIRDVRRGIGSDKRIGMDFLYPGPGYGGSCFPKDVSALAAQARAAGLDPALLDATMRTNESQHSYGAQLVLDALGQKRTLGVWGLAFKARTDDVRDSPAIPILRAVLQSGKRVVAHDPEAMENFRRVLPAVETGTRAGLLAQCDVLVILTEWDDYRTLSEEDLAALRGKTIVDLRNILARDTEFAKMRQYGIAYVGVGIPHA